MSPQSFQLVMQSGPTPGKGIQLSKPELYVGRDTSNDIVVNDAEVSRKHARLVLRGAGYTLEDLGSTNGTYVNGQRLMGPHVLRPGELILFGENVSMIYEASPIDADATVMSVAGQVTAQTPPPVPAVIEQPAPAFPRQTAPIYSGQVPPGPEEYAAPPPVTEKKGGGRRTWLLAGCGCLLLLACFCLAVFLVIDQPWNPGGGLYCKPPFDVFFNLFGICT